MPSTLPVGENIKELRKDRGLSQGDLAKRVGMSQASLSEIESGRTKFPSSNNLLKIASVLGVDPNYFLGNAEKSSSANIEIDRLILSVESVEEAIIRAGQKLTPRSKAKLIAHLYESEEMSPSYVDKFVGLLSL
jgi:transcriptional regulator with XRE-family HTH domain